MIASDCVRCDCYSVRVDSRCLFFVSLWLRNYEPEATKKYSASLPRREELNRLKRELCHKFDLVDIRYTHLLCFPLTSGWKTSRKQERLIRLSNQFCCFQCYRSVQS